MAVSEPAPSSIDSLRSLPGPPTPRPRDPGPGPMGGNATSNPTKSGNYNTNRPSNNRSHNFYPPYTHQYTKNPARGHNSGRRGNRHLPSTNPHYSCPYTHPRARQSDMDHWGYYDDRSQQNPPRDPYRDDPHIPHKPLGGMTYPLGTNMAHYRDMG